MDWLTIVCGIAFVIVVVLMMVVAVRNMNHNYTIGSGMFKMSDDNLDKEKKNDPSDYDYYNKEGHLK